MTANLNRRPSGSDQFLDEQCFKAFLSQRCVLGPTLVVPMRTLFSEYQGWCLTMKIDASSKAFRSVLDNASWAEVVERPEARGRFKAIVKGIGIMPAPQTPLHV